MVNTLFHINHDGSLSVMEEKPYESEDLIQRLLEEYPEILAGNRFGSADPRRFILLAREMAVPDGAGASPRWALDHLFLDQDGVPILVEVKRHSDSRSRREVVGQMLDYAANGPAFWSIEDLRRSFAATQTKRKLDPTESLRAFLNDDRDEDGFWSTVVTNLRAGRLRMVFLVDSVPPELLRIVEFLAAHLRDAEVYLVEVRQHVGSSGRLLSTTVLGAEALGAPAKAETEAPSHESWLVTFSARHGAQKAEIARLLMDWMDKRGTKFTTSAQNPSVGMFVKVENSRYYPFFIKANGKAVVQLYYLMRLPAFADEKGRHEIIRQAGLALNLDLSGTHPRGEVQATMDQLQDPGRRERFFRVLEWIVETVLSGEPVAPPFAPGGIGFAAG